MQTDTWRNDGTRSVYTHGSNLVTVKSVFTCSRSVIRFLSPAPDLILEALLTDLYWLILTLMVIQYTSWFVCMCVFWRADGTVRAHSFSLQPEFAWVFCSGNRYLDSRSLLCVCCHFSLGFRLELLSMRMRPFIPPSCGRRHFPCLMFLSCRCVHAKSKLKTYLHIFMAKNLAFSGEKSGFFNHLSR